MATAVFPGANRPQPVPAKKARPFPTLSNGRAERRVGDLTIHRITETHHGRTLLTLGRAAEYLLNSRRYSTRGFDREAEVEAVHLLMGLSRSVFEEYAERRTLQRRFQDWVIERAVRVFE
ncbi:MAG TPA: hypothetical protein VHW70_03500 [Edaphobacter sp.]|jgi:hypothetical protein|nr:hypothetical protein [Edaphobacter sp.]